ncbi:hypothetical protein GCM10011511_25690 [Puia dinghuensis]|uniref:DUF1553 domain-containing protein n=1 Tax=Puia dinghuensis TaxID=1792502 RepID=A0A8J2UD65_9BACT|nr:hypothetical protein GCM10011511_25690 [Puia dinghuensis]
MAVAILLSIALVSWRIFSPRRPIDFNTQVKPILNKKCIICHGGVRRQADLSFLFRADALGKTKSGKRAIIPGDPDHSEMLRRLTLTDVEDRMPYKQPPLSKQEIAILRDWIKEGAKWGDHWAYTPVHPVEVPRSKASFFGLVGPAKNDWVRNDIDCFVWDKLKTVGLSPSQEADKATLLRRVSLDLTGLPPSAALAKRFLDDTSAGAYERAVDTLLASPHYGERWAALWLDLARYADTKGYERDDSRSIWRYRDWLITAFNQDKPYDRFLVEQLAGDLLPNPTDDQLIATAFHRNTMTNDEGGTDNEEFRTAAVLDRVNTTWQALMGTTFACVQCHSHPYDPFVHDDYYRFMAFFNDTRDEDSYADYPLLRKFSGEDSIGVARLTDWVRSHSGEQRAAEVRWFLRTWQPAMNGLRADRFVNAELADTKWLAMRDHGVARLAGVDLEARDQLIYRYIGFVKGGRLTLHLDSVRGPVLREMPLDTSHNWTIAAADLPVGKGMHDLYLCYENPGLAKKPDMSGVQFDWFCFTHRFPQGDEAMKKLYWRLVSADVPTVPVMMDNPRDMHRPTYVFEKGNWLVKGARVEPATPHTLNPFPTGAPRNRLGLAQWLTSPQNPLTARTMVNRLWEQLFGTGLVETLEDLGTQGATPTHRELLDFLAWRFMHEDGWSIKRMLREIVLSATYRQDSRVRADAEAKDADDRYYWRAPRVRLSAEEIRDQALAVSGLLDEQLYGPSVMPWQPKGIWLSPWNGQDWQKSPGHDQYRRALYTYWKRTAPYPSMISFDGVAREVCTARRIRTNTPLQALVLLNDSVYLEAAKHLADKMRGGEDLGDAIQSGYGAIMLRAMSEKKVTAMMNLYAKASKAGAGSPDAMTVVASALLNLDEVVTKN